MESISEKDFKNSGVDLEEKSSKVFHNSLFLSYFLMLFILVVIIVLVTLSSQKFSVFSSEKQINQINILINEEKKALSQLAMEYGWWTEAVDQIIYTPDTKWAETNVGDYLVDNYDVSSVLAYDIENVLRYSKINKNIIESAPLDRFDKGIDLLIRETLSKDMSDPFPSVGILNIGNKLHIISVMSFAVYEPTDLDIGQPHGYLILTRLIDDELLNSFSAKSGVHDIKIASLEKNNSESEYHSPEQVLFTDYDDNLIGVIYWSKDGEIKNFINSLVGLSIVMILCIFFISLFFYNNLYKYNNLIRRIIRTEKDNSEKLSFQANYDELTGLPNRHLFLDRLNQGIRRSIRNGKTSAMLFLDLDGFKNINDTLGHETGDELLILVGQRLKGIVRSQDTVSRFGGDEFCILLEEVGNVGNTNCVLSKIQDAFELPFILNGDKQHMGVSIGVVLIPDDGTDTVTLLRFADIAMYHAKESDCVQYHYFGPELDKKAHWRSAIRNGLSQAIVNKELALHYQPIYDLNDKSLKYVEALLRWNSEGSGSISPEDFIPIAEESGIIREIGSWVIEQSIRDILEINKRTNNSIRLSINVSVNQLRDPHFLKNMLLLTDRYEIEHSIIQLEITENLLIDDSIYDNDILKRLSDSGFKLVMDDFGTGYSSLSYIKNIPLETIKIDKSFISFVEQSDKNGALIKTIIFMAKSFGLDTVAEGIENQEQENFLLSAGCRYGQGFLFSRPVCKEVLIDKINNKELKVNSNNFMETNSLDTRS